MIYSLRYLLATLLVISSFAALHFLPLSQLAHYVWVYYQFAVVVAVLLIPLLYLLRVLVLKTFYALAPKTSLEEDYAAAAELASHQAQPLAEAQPQPEWLLP